MVAKSDKREQRTRELLDVAREILITRGLSGFSIEQLAKQAGYSRPTVYAHFESRDAVLDALAGQNLKVATGLIERAKQFEGTAREQAFALLLGYEVMARFLPGEFHMTELLGMPWVRTKLPPEIAGAFRSMVESYSDAVTTQVERAQAAGELVLQPGMTVGNIAFHSLTMMYGIYTSIVKERIVLALSNPRDPWGEARAALQSYWDGVGWQGSSEGHAAMAERFLKESFPDYWIQLKVEQLKRESGLDSR